MEAPTAKLSVWKYHLSGRHGGPIVSVLVFGKTMSNDRLILGLHLGIIEHRPMLV